MRYGSTTGEPHTGCAICRGLRQGLPAPMVVGLPGGVGAGENAADPAGQRALPFAFEEGDSPASIAASMKSEHCYGSAGWWRTLIVSPGVLGAGRGCDVPGG